MAVKLLEVPAPVTKIEPPPPPPKIGVSYGKIPATNMGTPVFLKNIYPDVPGITMEHVTQVANENPDAFIEDIIAKGRNSDTETLLKNLGLTDSDMNWAFAPTQPTRVLKGIEKYPLPELAWSYEGAKLRSKEGMGYGDFLAIPKEQQATLLKANEDFERFRGSKGEDLIRIVSTKKGPIEKWEQIGQAVIDAVNKPLFNVAGIPISAETIAGVVAIGLTGYATVQEVYNATMEWSVRRNLDSWEKSANLPEPIPVDVKENFIRSAVQNLSPKFLIKETIKTLFNTTKAGFTLTEAGAQAVEQNALSVVSQVAPSLVPLGTQTGAMVFGGLPINEASWAAMSIADKVSLVQSVGLEGKVASKGWKSLTPTEKTAITKVTPPKVKAPVIPEVTIPKAAPGMPEAGLQPSMIPEVVAPKEVFPQGKGIPTQVSMEEQLKLQQARQAAEVAPPETKAAYEAQAQIEGLKATHETDPVAQWRTEITVTRKVKQSDGTYKLSQSKRSVDLTSFIDIKEQGFPSYFTVKQAQMIAPYTDWSRYAQKGLKTYNKVPVDAVLDELADKWGMTTDQIADRVMAIRAERQQIKALESEIKTQFVQKPLKTLPEPKPGDVTLSPTGERMLTPAQVTRTLDLFGQYVENPTTLNAWELTRELRRETLSGRVELLKGRTQELIVEKGMPPEEAMNQAIKETLSGELPVMRTDYLDDLTNHMRAVLFTKVYESLKDDPLEMASTLTALTNALLGKAIPRIPGIKGGSAFTRLQRVFGNQPKVLKAIEKIAEEKKPLEDIVEGIYHETEREPIPVDQATADYLRGLSTDILYQPTVFREPTPIIPYEAPITEAIRQVPLWPAPARDAVIRVLKEMAWGPVDIGNFLRAMKSSVDMSYWRQIMPLVPGHPVAFALSNVDAWKGTFSQKSAEAQWLRITRSPLYAIYDALQVKQGRDFLRPIDLPKGTAQWKGVEEFGYLTKDRTIPRLTSKIPTIKWSNRGFVSGCNSDTWNIYESFYKLMLRKAELYASGELTLKEGETFDIMGAMDAEATKLADWTGRASLGKISPAAPAISAFVYAPRYAVGRIIGPRHLFSSNPYVRRQAWKDAALFVGVVGGFVMLGRQLGWWDVETDPRSADFMKIRIGNLHIDPWGGVQQFAVFYAKVVYILTAPVTGEKPMGKSTTTGAYYPLDFLSLTENFLKSKEAPLAAAFLEYMTGKTYGGEKVDVKNLKQWADRIAPMSIQDIYESIMEQPGTTVIASILSFTGFGVQTYTGDWKQNIPKLGLPKYSDNVWYGMTEPVYDWADFYSDTASQFKGVDPASLTEKKGYPPKVKLVVETARSLDESSIIPNQTLISMNADPAKGKTFTNYYQIWQERQKIVDSGDEKALTAFDADERHNQAYLGNISQSQFTLLTEYWSITDKKKQADFLANHPELSQNPREQWLISHPEDNARQALAGKVKVMTQKAYDIAQNLIKVNDIPISAVAPYLPPDDIAKSYFERNDIVSKWGANSWEDKLLRANNPKLVEWLNKSGNPLGTVDTPTASLELKVKNRTLYDTLDGFSNDQSPNYIADDKARAEVIAKFKTDNPVFVDDMRRVDAIEAGTNEMPTPQMIIDSHVTFMKMQDAPGVGSSSAEVMLYRVDNPEYNAWRMDVNIWGDQALKPVDETRIPIWRIDVKYAKQDTEYDDLPSTGTARADYLTANDAYRMDRRRREAYQKGLDTGLIEPYVSYYELPTTGYRQDRFLLNNPDFANTLGLKIPDKVPSEQYDILLEKRDKTPEDLLRMDAYQAYIPDSQVEDYVSYYTIVGKGKPSGQTYWFEDDWYLLEHPEFYKTMVDKGQWQPKDFSKVPPKDVFELYQIYDAIIGSPDMSRTKARQEFRRSNPRLDAWLVLIGAVSQTIEEYDVSAGMTTAEKVGRQLAAKRAEIDELKMEIKRKLTAMKP